MNKEQFLKELDCMLGTLPAGDRDDAVAYYRDYLEEAGPEQEAEVLRELGSPQKVAKNIIDDWQATGSRGSRVYSSPEEDNRRKFYDRPQEDRSYSYGSQQNSENHEARGEREAYGNQESYGNHEAHEHYREHSKRSESHGEKKISWPIIIILILTFPVWIGVVAGLFGGIFGLLGGLLGSGFGLTIGGIALAVAGFFSGSELMLFTMLGVGMLLVALGIMIWLLLVWLGGVWIPALIRLIVRGCKRLFGKETEEEGGNEI